MGDNQRRLGAVNFGMFVGVDLNTWPTVYIAIIVLTRTEMNQTNYVIYASHGFIEYSEHNAVRPSLNSRSRQQIVI